jgi:hypothetical protein
MAVQGTGATAIVIADVPGLSGGNAPQTLATLGRLTGAVMLVAGVLRSLPQVPQGRPWGFKSVASARRLPPRPDQVL